LQEAIVPLAPGRRLHCRSVFRCLEGSREPTTKTSSHDSITLVLNCLKSYP